MRDEISGGILLLPKDAVYLGYITPSISASLKKKSKSKKHKKKKHTKRKNKRKSKKSKMR